MALIAAGRSDHIETVITVATPGVKGSELALDQQQRALDALTLPADEKQRRVQLQAQIMNAVVTGQGWEGVPEAMRKAADTPYFQSVLAFEPAVVMKKVRQPLLILHGERDRQVGLSNAELLSGLAVQRKRGASQLVMLPGINHLLVPAPTGEVSEYGSLGDAKVSPEVARVIVDWLGTLWASRSR
ncbi:MAG: hypothetical protein H0V80_03910 [Acidobacteria bacterium]|nr:hypothetical protein [Acidobacteriota bacterium]